MSQGKRKGYIIIDRERCKGCYLCIDSCPNRLIQISNILNAQGYYPVEFSHDGEKSKGCNACATCATVCPDIAIEVYSE